jgi:hypothetical protein
MSPGVVAAYSAPMRRPLLPLVLTLMLALGLVLSGAGTASAKARSDTASVSDKSGDAPAGIDLLSGFYSISNKKAIWSVRVRRLTETTFLAFESWPLNSSWDRITVFRENGRTVGRVYFVDNEEDTTPYLLKCPDLKVTWKPENGKVRVVVPRKCMQSSAVGGPYEFHVFSRFGGQKNGLGDTMPTQKLNY